MFCNDEGRSSVPACKCVIFDSAFQLSGKKLDFLLAKCVLRAFFGLLYLEILQWRQIKESLVYVKPKRHAASEKIVKVVFSLL